VGVILPTFCPTDLHRPARPRISLNGQSARTPSDQGERDCGESPRTAPDKSHPAENRKVGGSIPSLPTRFAQVRPSVASRQVVWTHLSS
jgi:hypothetical protein